MTGNFHVQFLGEGVAATPPPYPARMEKGCSRLTVTAVANGLTNSGVRHSLASRPPYWNKPYLADRQESGLTLSGL